MYKHKHILCIYTYSSSLLKNVILYNCSATSDDEMCNFYVMYWVEGTEPLEQQLCVSEGSPRYYWYKDPYLSNIPDKEASTL